MDEKKPTLGNKNIFYFNSTTKPAFINWVDRRILFNQYNAKNKL